MLAWWALTRTATLRTGNLHVPRYWWPTIQPRCQQNGLETFHVWCSIRGSTQTEAGVPSSPRHATSRQLDATSRDVAKSGHPSARPTGTRVENGHPSFRRAPELKTGTRVQPGPRQQARQGAGELPLLSSVEARAPGEIWGAQRGYHPVHTWPATETQNKGAFQGE